MDSEPGRFGGREPLDPLRFVVVTATGWRRLGELFRLERLNRKMTQAEFGAAVGMSEAQVRNLENGYRDRYDQDTLWLVDKAMRWQPGSAERVARDLEPIEESDPLSAELREAWSKLDPDQREAALRMIQQMGKRD
jgi:transcriptional regulator with XRE-family HTH domain